jgi:hypothetical protein
VPVLHSAPNSGQEGEKHESATVSFYQDSEPANTSCMFSLSSEEAISLRTGNLHMVRLGERKSRMGRCLPLVQANTIAAVLKTYDPQYMNCDSR